MGCGKAQDMEMKYTLYYPLLNPMELLLGFESELHTPIEDIVFDENLEILSLDRDTITVNISPEQRDHLTWKYPFLLVSSQQIMV
jgi:hypothetical protein